MLSSAQKRKNEIDAVLSGYWARADQAWLVVLLRVSDEAPDADKTVIWNTCVEIAALRGWKWSINEGRWVRSDATSVSEDGNGHNLYSGPKPPPGPPQPSEQANSGDSVAGK